MIAYLAPMIFSTIVFDQVIMNYQKTKSTKIQMFSTTVVFVDTNKIDYLILFRSYIHCIMFKVVCGILFKIAHWIMFKIVHGILCKIVHCILFKIVHCIIFKSYMVSCSRSYWVSCSKWYKCMLHHVQDHTFYHV